MIAGTRQLPADPALLRTVMLPSAAGGPGGGLTIGVAIPPPPDRAKPARSVDAGHRRDVEQPARWRMAHVAACV